MAVEYKDLVVKRKKEWIEKLKECMESNDTKKAYSYYKKLVRSKMIVVERKWKKGKDGEGSYISKYSELKEIGEELESQYGKVWVSNDDIPDTVFNENPVAFDIEVESREHWTERVELVYRGDIIAPAKKYTYRVGLISEVLPTISAIERMKERYKINTGRDMKLSADREKIESGFLRVFSINLASGQAFKMTNLGYICVSNLGYNGLKAMVVLETKMMNDMSVDILSTYKRLVRELKEVYKECNVDKIEVIDCMNINRVGEDQRKNKKEVLSMQKFIEKENKKIEDAKELA